MNQFGYPVWISATQFLNLLFMAFFAGSGIQILASFPRLYLDDLRRRPAPPSGGSWCSWPSW